jgi:hypothetical protein
MERLAGAKISERTIPAKLMGQTEWDPFSIPLSGTCVLAWLERDQSIFVADSKEHVVIRVPLPDRVFLTNTA